MSRRGATTLLLCLLSSAVLVLTPSAAAGGGCHAKSDEITSGRAEGDSTLLIEGCQYERTVFYIEPGSTVTWDNRDPVPHTVTGAFLSIGSDRMIEAGDDPVSYTFDNAGVFPYYCVLHPGMAGAIVVGDVDASKAAAEPLEASAVAVPPAEEPPPTTGVTEETSSNTGPIAIGAGLATLLIAGVTFVLIRGRKPALHGTGEQPAG